MPGQRVRAVFITTYLLSLVVLGVSHAMLPAEVAIHFGGGGQADGWAPRAFNPAVFVGMITVLFAMIMLTPRLTFTLPPSLINLPNKAYWLAEENKAMARAIFTALIYEFGAVLLAFMAGIVLLTLKANLSQPVRLDHRLFWPALAAFMLYTVVWCVRLFTSFRVPAVGDGGEPVRPS